MLQSMTGHPVVDAIGHLRFEGNLIPHSWYKHIRYSNKRGDYTDHLACLILADIVYWFRPTAIRDEHTGELIGWKKKFAGDKLQRSPEAFADLLGATPRQIRASMGLLESLKLIEIELKPVTSAAGTVPNLMFISLNPQAVTEISYRPSKINNLPKNAETLEKSLLPISVSQSYPNGKVRHTDFGKSELPKSVTHPYIEISPEINPQRSLSPTPLSAKLPDESPPPTPKEREREPSLKAEENSQRDNEIPRLRSNKKAKSLHTAKNPDSDTQAGGVAVARIYEIEPGVVNQDFLKWRSRYYIEQGGKWAKAPVSNALSDIQKSESRALALWQDYQNSIARQSGTANQPLEFSPAQMTDRQHKDWAQEYQANREEFMAKPEAAAWLAYVEARPSFKEMIFGGINNNGTTAQQGQLARIQRKEATAVPNRGGRGDSRSNPARSRGGDEQGSGLAKGGSLLRDLAQDCLQDLLEPLQGG